MIHINGSLIKGRFVVSRALRFTFPRQAAWLRAQRAASLDHSTSGGHAVGGLGLGPSVHLPRCGLYRRQVLTTWQNSENWSCSITSDNKNASFVYADSLMAMKIEQPGVAEKGSIAAWAAAMDEMFLNEDWTLLNLDLGQRARTVPSHHCLFQLNHVQKKKKVHPMQILDSTYSNFTFLIQCLQVKVRFMNTRKISSFNHFSIKNKQM